MRKRKCQDPGQTSQRSCGLLAQRPHARPSTEGGSKPRRHHHGHRRAVRGAWRSPTPRKGAAMPAAAETHTAGPVPVPRRGWPRAARPPWKGKVRGAEPAQGQMGACRGHVTRTGSQVSMFLGVCGGQPGRPSLCVMVSWVWCCPLLGGSCPGGPPPIRGSEPQAPRPAALFPPSGLSCTRFL